MSIKKLIAGVLAFLLITSLLPEWFEGKVYASGAYMIDTVAGTGTGGYSGDGGAATSTPLNNPSGVAVDSDGNIYILRILPTTVSGRSTLRER